MIFILRKTNVANLLHKMLFTNYMKLMKSHLVSVLCSAYWLVSYAIANRVLGKTMKFYVFDNFNESIAIKEITMKLKNRAR